MLPFSVSIGIESCKQNKTLSFHEARHCETMGCGMAIRRDDAQNKGEELEDQTMELASFASEVLLESRHL